MSLISVFTDAFKKAANRRTDAAKEAIDSGSAGSLGSTTQSGGGAFTPLRPAPEPDSQPGLDPAGMTVESADPQEGGQVAADFKLEGVDLSEIKLESADPQEGGQVVADFKLEGVDLSGVKIASADPQEGRQIATDLKLEGTDLTEVKIASADPQEGGEATLQGSKVEGILMEHKLGGIDPESGDKDHKVEAMAAAAERGDSQEDGLAALEGIKAEAGLREHKLGGIDPESSDKDHKIEGLSLGDSGGAAAEGGAFTPMEPGKLEFPNVRAEDVKVEGGIGERAADPFKTEFEDLTISSTTPAAPSPIPTPYPLEAADGLAGDGDEGAGALAKKVQQDYLEVKMENVLVSSRETSTGTDGLAGDPAGAAVQDLEAGAGDDGPLEAFKSAKVSMQDMHFTHATDKATPKLNEVDEDNGSSTLVDLDAEADAGMLTAGGGDSFELPDLDVDTDVEELEL